MTCTYTLTKKGTKKGEQDTVVLDHVSELELDDKLLEINHKHIKDGKYSDIVFSKSEQTINNIKIIEEKIIPDYTHHNNIYKTLRDAYKVVFADDEQMENFRPPYMGVNKFLSSVIPDGDDGYFRLYPEFKPDEYWARKFKKWNSDEEDKFTEEEIECFFGSGESGKQLAQSFVYTPEKAEKMRKDMEYKWRQQGAIGDEIHKVMELYFKNITQPDKYKAVTEGVTYNHLDQNKINQALQYAEELHSKLIKEFGDELTFYTELGVTQKADAPINGQEGYLRGTIDLLVLDKEGGVHIIDYKTSVKPYTKFIGAKRLAFVYQLAVYGRMLERYGFNMHQLNKMYMIAPIRINNFRREGQWSDPKTHSTENHWVFDDILQSMPEAQEAQLKAEGKKFDQATMLMDLTSEIQRTTRIIDNLNKFIPTKEWYSLTTKDLIKETMEWMRQCFPKYKNSVWNDEQINELIQEYKGFTPVDGKLIFKAPQVSKNPIIINIENGDVASAEIKMKKKVEQIVKTWPEKRTNWTLSLMSSLQEAIGNPQIDADIRTTKYIEDSEGQANWLNEYVKKYYKDGANYEILNITQNLQHLSEYGIILLKNKDTNHLDILRVSTQSLLSRFRTGNFSKRLSLFGQYEDDLIEKKKNTSLATMAVYGNIELMETMAVLNNIAGSFKDGNNVIVDKIQIINPFTNRGLSMTNEELLYNYSELCKKSGFTKAQILEKNSPLKFASRWEILMGELQTIMNSVTSEKKAKLQTCKTLLEQIPEADIPHKIKELQNFIKELQSKSINMRMNTKQDSQYSPEVRLYNAALLALADLKGIKFRQQIERYGDWMQLTQIFRKGLNSLKFDNPGHTNSDTLNLLAKITMEDYQNVRDDLMATKSKIEPLIKKLKEEARFSKLEEWTVGNQASLYSNMFRDTEIFHDLILKNPWDNTNDLRPAEREFLKEFLIQINKDRMGSNYNLEKSVQEDNLDFFKLPLTKGNRASEAAALNLNLFEDVLNRVKKFISYLNPTVAIQKSKAKFRQMKAEIERDMQSTRSMSDDDFFTMTNHFDTSNDAEERARWVQHPEGTNGNKSYEYFEHNLETLLYKHRAAYSTKEHIDKSSPLYKAALIHLTTLGVDQNGKFKDEIQYVRDFFQNKVKGEPLGDVKDRITAKVLAKLREAASLATLGFSPISFTYQILDGFWKDISLIIRKPMDSTTNETAFTFQHMSDSFKAAFADLFTFGRGPTLSNLLNQLYGLNDMDMNVIYDKIKSDQWGLYNWKSLAFYGAARPDFYNRLSIFGAQMRADGSWDAHRIGSNGELIYDWKLDKRFNLFANDINVGSEAYELQKARYYKIAQQFEREGVKDKDGNIFHVEMGEKKALPRAYTNQEAESMKSLCDTLYGYYSHERKSMIQSTTIGALWMQYRTYWSGKKNQYLENGGIKLRGSWKQATQRVLRQDGTYVIEKMYDVQDPETGAWHSVSESQLPEGSKKIPSIVWEGQWEEGIALTMAKLYDEVKRQKSFTNALKAIVEDEDFGRAYKANLMQVAYDTAMFLFIGAAVNTFAGEELRRIHKNRDKESLIEGLEASAANVILKSIQKSFLDFNFIASIGEPGITWNPFAFTWIVNTIKNLYGWSTGDKTNIQMFESTFNFAKQFSEFLDTVDVTILHDGVKDMPKHRKAEIAKSYQNKSPLEVTFQRVVNNTPILGAINKRFSYDSDGIAAAAKEGGKLELIN